jgi:hypothetical protein
MVIELLVTNAEVPLRFKRDLAIPPEQVMPIGRLGTAFRPTG